MNRIGDQSVVWRMRARRTLAMGLLVLAGGCERDDANERAIVESRNTLTAAGSGGSVSPPRAALDRSYSQVLATIRRVEGGSASEPEIAAAIGALASWGQGGLASSSYRDADSRLLAALNNAKALLDLCVRQHALASALQGYDPSADVQRFEAEVRERQTELNSIRQALEANEALVGSLRARAEEQAEGARGMMQSLASMRARLTEATPEERAEVARRLQELRRQAEAVMKESEVLTAEAERVAPLSAELRFELERVERQIGLLESAKEGVNLLSRQRADASAEALRSAESASADLAEALGEVLRIFREEVQPAYQSASAMLSNAASQLSRARGGPDQRVLATAVGYALQGAASLHREFSESAGRAALILEMSAAIRPAIPRADMFEKTAAAMREDARAAVQAALEQYERARASFASGGGSGDLRDRLDRVASRIDEMRIRLGATPDAPPADAPVDEPPALDADSPSEPPSETGASDDDPGDAPESGQTPDGKPDHGGDPPSEPGGD